MNKRGHRGSPCPHYPNCFGCPFINLPYPEQLIRKRKRVEAEFGRYPTLADINVLPVTPSPRRLGYRSRVKLVVRKTRSEVMTGLYVPGSHRVADISSCPVHPRPVNAVLRHLKRMIHELGIIPYDERSDSGQLRYLDIRYSFSCRELSVSLVTRHRDFPQGPTLARVLTRKFAFVTGVIQNINEGRGNVIWGEKFLQLAGGDMFLEQIGSLKFGFPPAVFSQANPFTAVKLYEKVVGFSELKGRETVLDLYCGVGPISLQLARASNAVWGIDDDVLSIDGAKQNARRNGISNCRFFAGDVAVRVAEAKQTLQQIDLLVLNPPRTGVQPAAMAAILAANAPRVIYVSCDPGSLSRDLDRLVKGGYRLLQVQPFDMFPQTQEVETVAILQKR